MDQGIAAVLAGGFGLVGAVAGAFAGGIWAVRGAKIGGSKAVEAARLQIEGQAAAEQLQWVRGQRQQAYGQLLDAQSAVEDTLARAAPGIRAGGRLSDEARDELTQRSLTLQKCTRQIALWGPEEVIRLAHALAVSTIEATQALRQAQGGGAPTSGGSRREWAHWDRANQEMTQAHSLFLERAGAVIRAPSQAAR